MEEKEQIVSQPMTAKQRVFTFFIFVYLLLVCFIMLLCGKELSDVLAVLMIAVTAWLTGYWCGAKVLPSGVTLD